MSKFSNFNMSHIYMVLATFLLATTLCKACVPQVCRKKRNVVDNSVSLQLRGCSGSSPSWVRQVASCLSINSANMSITIKQWYSEKYDICINNGCRNVKDGARDRVAIDVCLDCWFKSLASAKFLKSTHVKQPDIEDCVYKYLYSFLSNELPTLETDDAYKGTVRLPANTPPDNWWEITVQLPCKPPVFMFWNAYCVNSFVEGLGNNDFALVQNNIIEEKSIKFFVQFDNTCRFPQDKIKIMWSESIPAPALPQLSSFPPQYPPREVEPGNIYMDQEALKRLVIADGKMPAEFAVAGKKANPRRRKRQAKRVIDRINELGVMFPCAVKSFNVSNQGNTTTPSIGKDRRYVIDTSRLGRVYKDNKFQDYSIIDFDLNYGFNETGCFFDSSDVRLVVNPEEGWVDQKLPPNPRFHRPESTNKLPRKIPQTDFRPPIIKTATNTRSLSNRVVNSMQFETRLKKANTIYKDTIKCAICEEAKSNEECAKNGTVTVCNPGEICLSVVRQITKDQILITKSCKQRHACSNIEVQNSRGNQCRPGELASVCRCCCESEECSFQHLPCI